MRRCDVLVVVVIVVVVVSTLMSFYLEYEDVDGRSQIKVHTDKRTPTHGARCSLAVTHPGTNRARRPTPTYL